jgi:hypothetical protein
MFRFGIQFRMRGVRGADHIPEVLDHGVLEPGAGSEERDSSSAGQGDSGNCAFRMPGNARNSSLLVSFDVCSHTGSTSTSRALAVFDTIPSYTPTGRCFVQGS